MDTWVLGLVCVHACLCPIRSIRLSEQHTDTAHCGTTAEVNYVADTVTSGSLNSKQRHAKIIV